MKRHFHHIGLPTDEKHEGETYVEDTKVWVTNPEFHKHRIEFLRFEPDSSVTGPIRDLPHVAFRVKNIKKALADEKEVILKPFSPMAGLTVAFFMRDGAVFEYMEFEGGATEFSQLPQG